MKFQIPKGVSIVLERLEQAGQEAYLVGGCVRDTYMGVAPQDYDITTSALPQQIAGIFRGERVLETGIAHGTLTILTADGPVEVTTYRQDGDYSDHRHPDQVFFTRSLREDLARRDYTMNAMAMDLRGKLIDHFGGQADIDACVIRCVGEASRRFEEDALRILRGLRFAARLGFAIEMQTKAAMHHKKALLQTVAAERIFAEGCGLLQGNHAVAVLAEHRAVLEEIFPEWKEFCPREWQQRLQMLAALPTQPNKRLAALLQKETAPAVLARLKVPNTFRQEILMLLAEQEHFCPPERVAVRKRCVALGVDNLLQLLEFQRAADISDERTACFDAVAALVKQLVGENACLSLKDLAVKGADLMALGYQGAAIGESLSFLLERVTEETIPNEKEALLQAIKNR